MRKGGRVGRVGGKRRVGREERNKRDRRGRDWRQEETKCWGEEGVFSCRPIPCPPPTLSSSQGILIASFTAHLLTPRFLISSDVSLALKSPISAARLCTRIVF